MELTSVGTPALWIGFVGFVLAMLALDLGVFHRKAHAVRFKEALAWSGVWIALALLFNLGIWVWLGPQPGLAFLTGYLIEKSLSIDNIFVFVVVFGTLAIPEVYRHRVLFWGILSALVLRAAMIFAGAALLERFHWLIYAFGALLVLTGVKLLARWRRPEKPAEGRMLRWAQRAIPSTQRLEGGRFFVRQGGRWLATPLFLALVLVELTDLIFAVDSLPAIFAVTQDPFIVFSSNIFALLGLRSLFFVLGGMVERFHYLKPGLASVLLFVGAKMLIAPVLKVPAFASLAVIVLLLGACVVASLVREKRLARAQAPRVGARPAAGHA